MKKKIAILLILAAVIIIAIIGTRLARVIPHRYVRHSTLPSKNVGVILNGDFEQGTTGWKGIGESLPHQIKTSIDHSHAHSGKSSLMIENREPRRPEIYATVAQTVPAKFQSRYQIQLWVKADAAEYGCLQIASSLNWVNMVQLPPGSCDWTNITFEVNTGWHNFIPLCIVSENRGTVWIDDITVRPLPK
jgi:hypothetical protein